MNWYYIANGEQQGPVSEEELMRVIGNDPDGASLMIWKEGLPEWTLASVIFPKPSPPVLVPPPMPKGFVAMGVCCECGKSFPANDMVSLQGQALCVTCQPVAVQKIKEGAVVGSVMASGGAFRDGNCIMTMDRARLPGRCVKCNVETGNWVKRKLSWHHPAYALLIFVGLIIYVIVGLLVSKKATIEVGFCERHRKGRIMHILLGWGGFFAGIMVMIGGFANESVGIGVLGIALMLAGLVYAIVRANIVSPKRIDDDGRVWLKGACREYLESLPSTNG